MNIFMSKRSIASIFLAFMMLLTMAACGNNAVDTYLDEYEKFVVKYEEMAKKETITADDYTKIAQEAMEFQKKSQEVGASGGKVSDKQMKRTEELTQRLMKATQEVAAKVS